MTSQAVFARDGGRIGEDEQQVEIRALAGALGPEDTCERQRIDQVRQRRAALTEALRTPRIVAAAVAALLEILHVAQVVGPAFEIRILRVEDVEDPLQRRWRGRSKAADRKKPIDLLDAVENHDEAMLNAQLPAANAFLVTNDLRHGV